MPFVLGRETYMNILKLVVIGFTLNSIILNQLSAMNIEYPKDSNFINVKDFGVIGDGKTDDTEAILNIFKSLKEKGDKLRSTNMRTIYFPNGTYLVSKTIGWKRWRVLQGQSREGTIIQLKDNLSEFGNAKKPKPMIFAAVPGKYSNDSRANAAFANYISHFTLNTGKGNPGAIAARYTTHNTGVFEHVTIKSDDGKGAVGLDLSDTEFGPGMVRHLLVEGFDLGIKTTGRPSNVTMEHIEIKNQNVLGMSVLFPVSLYNFKSTNKVTAIEVFEKPLAQLVLIKGVFNGGSPSQPAIKCRSSIYCRDISSSGYEVLIDDENAKKRGPKMDSYVSGQVESLFSSKTNHLNLSIKNPPEPIEEPISKWVKPLHNPKDSTQGIRDAINAGASTIYLDYTKRYDIKDTIVIPASVNRIVGMHSTIYSAPQDMDQTKPLIRIVGDSDTPLIIEKVSIGRYPSKVLPVLEIDANRPVYLKYVKIRGKMNVTEKFKSNDLFLDECLYRLKFESHCNVWIRQFNVENNPYHRRKSEGVARYLKNYGADIWILGMKTESPALHLESYKGGKVELLGAFFRDHFPSDEIPYFKIEGGELSASYVQYTHKKGRCRSLQAVETKNKVKQEFTLDERGNKKVSLFSTIK